MINLAYKERTPVKCSCSLRSLVGFDISEAQAITLIGVPIIDRRSNGNKDTAIGIVDAICYDKDLVYMTLYSYWLPEIQVDDNRKFQSFGSVSFEINSFEVEEKFPTFFKKGNNLEYIIKGDTPEFKDCLVYVCGKSLDVAKEDLHRMLNNPNENDKKLIQNMGNLRIEETEDKDCWWNFNCD